MCVFNFSPGNVTGCPGANNCIGHHCTLPNRCLVDCHDNCKHECGQGWSRQSRWNDEEECVNECDANCSRNCKNVGNKRSAAVLGGKYLLNWYLDTFDTKILFYPTGGVRKKGYGNRRLNLAAWLTKLRCNRNCANGIFFGFPFPECRLC